MSDPTPGPGDLFDHARELLASADRALISSTGGRIDRRFVSPGRPTLDVCEQLTVHCESLGEADTLPLTPALAPAFRPRVQGAVHLVSFMITVIRCCPVFDGEGGNPPTAEEYERTAEITHGDAWAIWNHVRDEYRAGELFAGHMAVYFDPPVPIPIQGGAAGWTISIRINLDGYDPS